MPRGHKEETSEQAVNPEPALTSNADRNRSGVKGQKRTSSPFVKEREHLVRCLGINPAKTFNLAQVFYGQAAKV
jgi:hypothetical protein